MLKFKIFLTLFLGLFFSVANAQVPIWLYDPLDNMPILEKTPQRFGQEITSNPLEQRGPEFRNFLAASLKISVNGSSGSGTIVYYDPIKNLAYVASCGHIWEPGTMSVESGKKRNMHCKVITWYHNEKKLEEARSYDARVIFYTYIHGVQDTSLMTFTPDWKPQYFPIAPVNYPYKSGKHVHSVGCDGGSEVAHYDVEIIGVDESIVTQLNSPRPGRSGGGLMDDNGYYIGTCWGTQYRDGSGKGFFTSLSTIHNFWNKQKGYEFLLQQKRDGLARQIPIRDYGIEQKTFSEDYILLPIH